jgi:hypothetical protein
VSDVPPPVASPEPPYISSDSPSGSWKLTTVREAMAIADESVEKTAKATKLQWIGLSFLGALTLGVGGFLAWCLITLGVIGNAQAQTQATANAALDKGKTLEQRVEAVDAGMRAGLDRLERKIDVNKEDTDKKLEGIQRTLVQVLQEARKK